ncbi:KH domain-containing protein [Patescibacteria group bacterium]|nr:KH domain-containing protein [Patescibacteria group bacterium]
MQNNQDQDFLEYVIKMLVDNPDDVKVARQVDEMGVLLTLDVNPADMGKVIGRSGNTAKAIRILLRVVGMKNNARVNLKINEPAGSTRGMGMGGGQNGGMSPSYGSTVSMNGGSEQGSVSRGIDEALEDLKL